MILNLPDIATRGINTDVSPWDLPPEFISNGMNFRIGANSIVTYGSNSVFSTPPAEYNPAYAIVVRTGLNTFIVSAGKTIYSYQTSYKQIAGDNLVPDGSEYNWSGCLNGNVVILNNIDYYPVYWNGTTDEVVDLPWTIETIDDELVTTTWRDKGYSASVIRSHKNYLIALDVDDGGAARHDTFRWSTPADENAIPFTWDELNPSGIAGVQALGGDGGRILDGLTLRDSFVIYSENAINVLDLSGDEFVWRNRDMSETVGLLSKDCVVEIKGVHYLMTQNDIVTFDGNSIVSIAHDTIQDVLRGINTDFTERAFAFSNNGKKEIWFCIPAGDDENGNIHENVNIALIYQWKKNTWAIRELPTSTSFLFSAPEIAEAGDPWGDAVSGDQQPWEDDVTRWNDGVSAATFAEKPYAINYGNSLTYLLDPQIAEADINTYIERTDLSINDQINVTTLTRIYPHMYGSQPVRFRVGSQDRAGGDIRWKNWVTFDPDSDRKIDIRTTGALHCYRLESIGTGKFRFAGLDVEYEVDGIR